MAEAQGKTIIFFPEGAFGPTNNCVGIGEVLRRHGHRVVFVIEESFAGTLEEKGFEERLMRLAAPPEVEEEPGQFWKDFIRETAPVFRKSTFDQLGEFIAPTWEALLDGARYVDERLVEIFDELQPDAIVEDNVCAFPAIPASGRPWVRIVSCNPLELKGPELPPPYTGLSIDDRSSWGEYRDEYRRVTGDLQASFSEFCAERGAPPLPDGEMIHESPWLNLYLYPREVDYPRLRRPLEGTWHNLESSVRTTDAEWSVPAELADGDGSLIYVSLGSLGSGDVPLMKDLVAALAETPHRYVVSKGPQHAEYELADCRRSRSCRRSTWLSPTAATTRRRSASTSASRWSCCRSSGTSTTTRSGSTRPDSGSDWRPTRSGRVTCPRRSMGCSQTVSSAPASRMSRSDSSRVPALSGQPS
jgi:UDP:flavonoid glycosyltransferase YjiC (YdhE family)